VDLLALASRVRDGLVRHMMLRHKVFVGERPARLRVATEQGCLSTVFRINADCGLAKVMTSFEEIWCSHFSRVIRPGHRVLIKVNLNTGLPYPASTAPDMLKALLGFLHRLGITDILVGDCSSRSALPTRGQATAAGLPDAAAAFARMVYFDEGKWVRVPINGHYLTSVTVPGVVYDVDRIIALANMKSHFRADFSFGLKLGVGFMHPQERAALHRGHLQEKVAEINLAVQSDLTIIDGRTAFITGGPNEGETAEANVLIAGLNPLAVDLEAYRCLYALRESHGCVGSFQQNPSAMAQFSHAQQLRLGGLTWTGYQCVER
jgi:uncharacterized protein (DUF362 family)